METVSGRNYFRSKLCSGNLGNVGQVLTTKGGKWVAKYRATENSLPRTLNIHRKWKEISQSKELKLQKNVVSGKRTFFLNFQRNFMFTFNKKKSSTLTQIAAPLFVYTHIFEFRCLFVKKVQMSICSPHKPILSVWMSYHRYFKTI